MKEFLRIGLVETISISIVQCVALKLVKIFLLTNVSWKEGIYGDGAYCEYPLCEHDLTHTLLTCPMILAWCQKCERRGHLPSHHSSWVPMKLENFFLAYEPFNLLTGFKLLAPAMGLINRITDNVLRFSYYGNTWGELPKSFFMS
jgi:hypothetical protein